MSRKRPDVANHVDPPEPVAERRLTGAHWFDPDRLHHLEDMPKYCPACAAELGEGISVEYWEADERVYHTWCKACGWTGDITKVDRMIGPEAAE